MKLTWRPSDTDPEAGAGSRHLSVAASSSLALSDIDARRLAAKVATLYYPSTAEAIPETDVAFLESGDMMEQFGWGVTVGVGRLDRLSAENLKVAMGCRPTDPFHGFRRKVFVMGSRFEVEVGKDFEGQIGEDFELRQVQLVGIAALAQKHFQPALWQAIPPVSHRVALLADEVGLGKTLQVIGYHQLLAALYTRQQAFRRYAQALAKGVFKYAKHLGKEPPEVAAHKLLKLLREVKDSEPHECDDLVSVVVDLMKEGATAMGIKLNESSEADSDDEEDAQIRLTLVKRVGKQAVVKASRPSLLRSSHILRCALSLTWMFRRTLGHGIG